MNTSENTHTQQDDKVKRFAWINFMMENITRIVAVVYIFFAFCASNSNCTRSLIYVIRLMGKLMAIRVLCGLTEKGTKRKNQTPAIY